MTLKTVNSQHVSLVTVVMSIRVLDIDKAFANKFSRYALEIICVTFSTSKRSLNRI